jgi:pimeloyl-ACP methyl ester carboxylesterase
MQQNVLIIDCDVTLGGHVARHGPTLRPEAVFRIVPGCRTLARTISAAERADEVWIFADDATWSDYARPAALELLASAGAKELNIVAESSACYRGGPGEERSTIEKCQSLGLSYRIFHMPAVVHDPPISTGKLGRFFTTLYEFEREMEERAPWFFEYHALRCCVAEQAALDVIGADCAAQRALTISRSGETLNQCFEISPSASIPFSEFCEDVRLAFGSSLLPTNRRETLNAVDVAFESRLGGVSCLQLAPRDNARAIDANSRPIKNLEALRESLDAKRLARDQRVAGMPDSLERTTIESKGFPLTYYSGGRGRVPILLLNALGQGVQYWLRLMDELMRSHRVIVWEPRGTSLPPFPFTLADQVDDVEAILQHENAERCYLAGWCTGPKVAVEFFIRHPQAVSAMVFLNATFRCTGTPAELETQYERNSEPLFRLVAQRPAMAASVSKSLQNSVGGPQIDPEEDGDAHLTVDLLSAMNGALKRHVLAPFQSESVVANYAKQMVDFWSHDSLVAAQRVEAPVLLLASEYDLVAAPEMSRQAARHFPQSRFQLMPHASHYCLYDRPRFVADLITRFFEETSAAGTEDDELSASAGGQL